MVKEYLKYHIYLIIKYSNARAANDCCFDFRGFIYFSSKHKENINKIQKSNDKSIVEFGHNFQNYGLISLKINNKFVLPETL